METITHNGRIVQVIEYEVDFHGKKKMFEKARRAPGVRLIIENEKQEILLNKERRYELQADDFRLPGGKVFDSLVEYSAFLETGSSIEPFVLEAARREAEEEVGIHISDPTILTRKVCGTTMERDLRYIQVKDFSFSNDGIDNEEGGHIQGYTWHSYTSLYAMIKDGYIQEGRSVAVLVQHILFS